MEPSFFDKNDLKNLFPDKSETRPETKKETSSWKIFLKFAGLFVGIFLLAFLVVNFSALKKNLSYFWDVQIKNQSYQKALATPEPIAESTSNFDPTFAATLIIPKIGVNAPVVWNIDQDQVQERLVDGVVHSKGTALPGQKGNVFITGHSSYYSWSSSPYKDIFALLEKLAVGDKIYLQYSQKSFTYEITNTKVVPPNDLSVLEQTPNYNLTLMTCVPIGTNLNRLIITSSQISAN